MHCLSLYTYYHIMSFLFQNMIPRANSKMTTDIVSTGQTMVATFRYGSPHALSWYPRFKMKPQSFHRESLQKN